MLGARSGMRTILLAISEGFKMIGLASSNNLLSEDVGVRRSRLWCRHDVGKVVIAVGFGSGGPREEEGTELALDGFFELRQP